MNKQEILDNSIKILNEAYELDYSAIHALICNRVPCNKNLADHPSIVVDVDNLTKNETFNVGLLGIINGIIEPLTGKRIAAKFSDNDNTPKKLLGFSEYISKAI